MAEVLVVVVILALIVVVGRWLVTGIQQATPPAGTATSVAISGPQYTRPAGDVVPTITPTVGVVDTEVAVSPTAPPPTLTLTPAPSDTPVPTSRPTPLPTETLTGSPVYATIPPDTPQPLPIPPVLFSSGIKKSCDSR